MGFRFWEKWKWGIPFCPLVAHREISSHEPSHFATKDEGLKIFGTVVKRSQEFKKADEMQIKDGAIISDAAEASCKWIVVYFVFQLL